MFHGNIGGREIWLPANFQNDHRPQRDICQANGLVKHASEDMVVPIPLRKNWDLGNIVGAVGTVSADSNNAQPFITDIYVKTKGFGQ